jgi:hypothetical protein
LVHGPDDVDEDCHCKLEPTVKPLIDKFALPPPHKVVPPAADPGLVEQQVHVADHPAVSVPLSECQKKVRLLEEEVTVPGEFVPQ